MHLLTKVFPFLGWFKGYKLSTLRTDFISGLTVALVLVPQSMAYAQLAGLPAYYGLYAAFLPPMVASLFGSSRQLATGPVAVVSLMTSAALEPLATAGSEQFVAYALLLALMVGIFQLLLGVLRLGLVVNFLSHPVVNGFTNAAAIIIATSQLSKIFGVYVDKAPHHYETIWRVLLAAFDFTHWPTLGMAVLAFATMITLRRVNPRIPNVLVAVVVTTLLSWLVGFERKDAIPVDRVGSERVAQLVHVFNETVTAKELVEKNRSDVNTAWEQLETQHQDLCVRCHQERALGAPTVDWSGAVEPSEDRSSSRIMLHGMAGLWDRHLDHLKASISEHRAALRDVRLVRGTEHADRPMFFVADEVPVGQAVEDDIWRLKIGNNALSTDALTVSGGGAVVGNIPLGLPGFRWPEFDWSIVLKLLSAAIIISLLGFMEAISIAKAMAARTRQKLDPDQELIGQGLSNIVGCFFQSYAVSGSFSRSAVNLQAGGQTGLSNVFASGIVMAVLLFFATGLYHLPQAVLASVIMMAVFGLLNVSGFVHAWRTNRLDGAISIITFVGTLVFAPHLEWGIFIGVSLSLGAYLYRSMHPQVVELAPHPDGALRDAKRHELKKCRHLSVIGFEGPLNFASASYLESEISNRAAELPDLRHVVLAANGISEIDASGEETLRHVVDNLREGGCEISISGLPDKIGDVLKRSHLYERIGDSRFFATRAQALNAVFAETHRGSDEPECPFRQTMPPVVELSLHPDGSLRDAKRHDLRVCRHIAAFRFDGPLSATNVAYLEEEILSRVADRASLRHVVFVGHGIGDIEDAAAHKLGQLVERLRKDGLAVSFSGLKDHILDTMTRVGVREILGPGNFYPTQVMAIAGLYARAHAGSSEANCPLESLAPHLTELSLHHTGDFRDARKHHLRLCQHIGALRFDGPLVFANPKAIQSEFIRWAKTRPGVRHVVFLSQTVTRLDDVETENLLRFVAAVREAGFGVSFAGFTDQVFEDLGRRGAADIIGVDNIYPRDRAAIASVYSTAHVGDEHEECPFRDILPHVTELSLHPDGSLRDARRHGLGRCERIVAVRFDGPLNYATMELFDRGLQTILDGRPDAKHILLAGHTLGEVDPIAAEEIPLLLKRLKQEGYAIAVSGLRDDVIGDNRGAEWRKMVEGVSIYPTQAAAISAIFSSAHAGSAEQPCPLVEVVRIDRKDEAR